MRALAAVAILLAGTLSAAEVARVEGRVIFDRFPVPGCTVRLSPSHTTTTNADGRYSFLGVTPDTYTVSYELSGFLTETYHLAVDGPSVKVHDIELRLDPDQITFTCSLMACSDTEPATPFEQVSCPEYELNSALIESMERGDRSVIDLLRSRYETTFTFLERHRLAAALLGHVPDDRRYWNVLEERAAHAIRFAYDGSEPPAAFVEWCAVRGVDPHDYSMIALDALRIAAADPRGRSLVLGALHSGEPLLTDTAMGAILDDRDESFFPEIEKAMAGRPDEARAIAMWLAFFRSDAADRLAMKFLSGEAREEYAELRRTDDCESMDCDP